MAQKQYCKYCGEEIKKIGNYIAPKRVTCGGKVCRKKREKELREIYKIKGKPIPNKEKRKCAYCKIEFIWYSNKPHKKFCSKKCANEFHKQIYRKVSGGLLIKKGVSYNFLKLRFKVFQRDNFACQYCGRNVKEDKIKLHLDHIIPKSKGGLNNYNNLITSCFECNEGKKDVLLEERKK